MGDIDSKKLPDVFNKKTLFEKHPELEKKLKSFMLDELVVGGNFGTVFRAVRGDAEFAIKFQKLEGKNDKEGFLNTVTTLRSRENTNQYVVKLHDSFTVKKFVWSSSSIGILVFEYQGGGILRDLIAQSDGGLTEALAARFYLQVGNGLAYFHQEGIAHKAIQPDNILLDTSHTIAKLFNFELSQFCYNFHTGQVVKHIDPQDLVGTANYLPPEYLEESEYHRLIKDENLNMIMEQSRDIWAIGVTMFEMVYGVVPWAYKTNKKEKEFLERLKQSIVLGLCLHHKQTSKDFVNFILRHFIIDPSQRPTIESLLSEPFLVNGINCLPTITDDHSYYVISKDPTEEEMFEKSFAIFKEQFDCKGYKMVNNFGTGGFALVYGGMFQGRLCAVKLQRTPFVDDIHPDVIKELTFMKKLKHPNVIEILDFFVVKSFDFGIECKRLAITMAAASGGDLKHYYIKKNGLSEEQAARFYLQIGSGLQYCHRMGVAHKDLKPENVLLDATRTFCKIIDFGLSAYTYSLHSGNEQKIFREEGTLSYYPPEYFPREKSLLYGKPFDETKVDIWAMGTIMFTLVHGCVPFKHQARDKLNRSKRTQLLEQMLACTDESTEGWESIQKKPNVSQDFRKFVLAHWKLKPEHRPTIDELLSWPYLSIAHSFPLKASKERPTLTIDDFPAED